MADLTLRLVKGSPLTNAEVDANFSNLNEAITIGGEPMGHEDKTQSTLSFDAGTRTVTIAPVGGSFTVWVKGKKFVFTTAQTVVIPNTTGLHYVYFNTSGVLSSHMTFIDWPNEAPTAYVAWNATTGAAPFFADERHGVTLDWQTHEYLHRTRGAALASGFSISNYTVTGTGAADADAQLDLSGGTFFDEDLQVDITHSNTPTPNTWQQDLAGPAQIPVLYRSGSGWVRDNPTNFVLKAGTATPRYNTESGGVWGLTDVPNNSYSVVWVLATNNLTYPVVAIMGQYADNNSANAENFEWGSMNLDGFPSIEFRPLYKIVFQCSTSYTNAIKARFTKVFDVRNLVAASPAATIGSSHGGLSGLGADDHPQYVHITEVRSPSAAVKNSFLPAQTGNSGKFLTTDGSNPSWATMTAPNNGTLTLAVSGTGLSGSASFTADQAGNSTFTVTSNATSANTADTIVARDGSGNFSANIITATSFSGSASGLTGLKTVNGNSILGSGNIQIDGGVTSFNTRTGAITLSSADVTGALGFTPYNSTNPNGYTTNVGTVVGVTAGTGLAGGTITSSGTISLATSGVAAGTYTKVTVDVYGRATTGTSLSSSDVTTALGYTPPQPTGTGASGTWGISISGNAATATTLQTARTINGVSFNGSANITVADSTKLPLSGGTMTGAITFAAGQTWPTFNQSTTGSSAAVSYTDTRTIAPNTHSSTRLTFGFTSWANNNTAPYADYLHLRGYTDATGGSENLVMFRKDAIGIRVWQQSFGSATAYATYKDVAFTDSNITGSAAKWTTARTLSFTGDVTGSGSVDGSANVATAMTLANSGVTAGTYTKVTVDVKGRVTAGASLASADLPTYTGTLTSSQVTTALGFTPYNSTNPSGYITSSGNAANVTGTVAIANGGTGATSAAAALTNLGAYAATNPNGYITTPFPVGTVMLFAQTAAPTGWTKLTTHDNKALRVVSGTASSGGSVAFTTAFSSQGVGGTVGGTTLTTAQIPAHNHGINDPGHSHSVSDPGHNHSMRYGTPNGDYMGMYTGAGEGGWALANGSGNNNITRLYNNGSGTGIGINGAGTGISTQNSGSGGSHTHSFSGTAINLAVQYVDVIIATKG